jgi:hypothetical protein
MNSSELEPPHVSAMCPEHLRGTSRKTRAHKSLSTKVAAGTITWSASIAERRRPRLAVGIVGEAGHRLFLKEVGVEEMKKETRPPEEVQVWVNIVSCRGRYSRSERSRT